MSEQALQYLSKIYGQSLRIRAGHLWFSISPNLHLRQPHAAYAEYFCKLRRMMDKRK